MKVRYHMLIDSDLNEIIEMHCKCNNLSKNRFIIQCVAKELNIHLNEDGSINASDYIDCKVKAIDDCIAKLEKEKADLMVTN